MSRSKRKVYEDVRDITIGGNSIYEMEQKGHRDRFMESGGSIPPGLCAVTITLDFCGGSSVRTVKMDEKYLRREVVRFFDLHDPYDELVAGPPPEEAA